MIYILNNLVPIGLATLGALILQAAYVALVGLRPSAGQIAFAAVAEGWLAAILAGALILAPKTGAPPWAMALGSAIIIWIGFVAPALLVTEIVQGRGVGRAASNTAQWLVVMLLQAVVLHAVGLVQPA